MRKGSQQPKMSYRRALPPCPKRISLETIGPVQSEVAPVVHSLLPCWPRQNYGGGEPEYC